MAAPARGDRAVRRKGPSVFFSESPAPGQTVALGAKGP